MSGAGLSLEALEEMASAMVDTAKGLGPALKRERCSRRYLLDAADRLRFIEQDLGETFAALEHVRRGIAPSAKKKGGAHG